MSVSQQIFIKPRFIVATFQSIIATRGLIADGRMKRVRSIIVTKGKGEAICATRGYRVRSYAPCCEI